VVFPQGIVIGRHRALSVVGRRASLSIMARRRLRVFAGCPTGEPGIDLLCSQRQTCRITARFQKNQPDGAFILLSCENII
jgi:hypothetical protein